MILQALQEYYQRRGPESGIAPFGFEAREIPFIIHIDREGRFFNLEDTREKQGNKLIGKSYIVPKGESRSGTKAYEKPNLLWDHYGFVLKYAKRDKLDAEPAEKDIQAAQLQHEYFCSKVFALAEVLQENSSIHAIGNFLKVGDFQAVFVHSKWKDCANIKGCNLTFQVVGDEQPIINDPDVVQYVRGCQTVEEDEVGDSIRGICLVSGEDSIIERLHPAVTGITAKPAPLAAINDGVSPAFSSFGKSQGFNFPVGRQAAFDYTTALTHLLRKESRQKVLVGDAITVFWTARKDPFETQVGFFLNSPKDDPHAGTQAIRAFYGSVQKGLLSATDDKKNMFYVLGLAPNSARIAVRFWVKATVFQLKERFSQYFRELAIDHGGDATPDLPLFRLLLSIAALHKADNIPPNLAGETMRSILMGLPYPETLLYAAIRRNRAEQTVSYPRAAIIKACLVRNYQEDIDVYLDENNTNIGYRLGRLFSVLEKLQAEAHGRDINADISDGFYGAASATPITVFPTLIKLHKHHLSKLKKQKPGRAVQFEKWLAQIYSGIKAPEDGKPPFPKTLLLPDQANFSVGYYHQRQKLFKKITDTDDTPELEPGTQGELL